MRRSLLVVAAVLVLGTAVAAQVTWTVTPSPVPTEQVIRMTLTNRSGSSITLPSTAPWSIRDLLGGLVYGPIGLTVLVPLPDQQAITYTWNQKDRTSAFLAPGAYEVWIGYFDAKFQNQTLKAPLQIDPDRITVSGQPAPGVTVKLLVSSPRAPQLPYVAGLALAIRPELPIGGNRFLALAPDALLVLSLTAGPPIFRDFQGSLDASGAATAALGIPSHAALKGITVHAAHVTLHASAPNGILSYSAPQAIQIQ
ncbi:MAG: hypothetical protein JXQ29_00865 [Planctomycetes bacterium]|nr:hypothetical protein [Planctomycetota bacterium]